MGKPRRLILASTSPYRADLLGRLRLPFEVMSPGVDERAHDGEPPRDLAARLATKKAGAVAWRYPDAVVIGADQVAELDGHAIGKPGTHARATEQLCAMRGRTVLFHTAVAVHCGGLAFAESAMALVTVRFRDLTPTEIERYLLAEEPYDCAGSAKCETSGIALLESIDSDDPTALVGLPLIRTSQLLRRVGIDPFQGGASAVSTAFADAGADPAGKPGAGAPPRAGSTI